MGARAWVARMPHRPGTRRRGLPFLPLPVAPSPAKLRAKHNRRGNRRHAGTRGLLGQTFARRDGNRLRVQAGLPLRNFPNAGCEILAATFARVAIAKYKEQNQTVSDIKSRSGQPDARTRKTWARRGDFAINKWQTAPSPLHWGKVFAFGERVSRRAAGCHNVRSKFDDRRPRVDRCSEYLTSN